MCLCVSVCGEVVCVSNTTPTRSLSLSAVSSFDSLFLPLLEL